jgi:SP family general alpha glucoside:H+ symporter-like MFS transporter
MLILLILIPESPWYLVRKGKDDAALKALAKIYRGSGDDIDEHLARIQEVVEIEASEKSGESGTYFDLFRGTNRRRTITVAVCFACQELSGVQFVLGFSTYFFQLAGCVIRSFVTCQLISG